MDSSTDGGFNMHRWLPGSESQDLTACKQERPGAVHLRLLWSRVAGRIFHALNVAELAASTASLSGTGAGTRSGRVVPQPAITNAVAAATDWRAIIFWKVSQP